MGHYANECKSGKGKSGDEKQVNFAMMCYENSEEEKYENEEEENEQEDKNPNDKERKLDAGTVRNTEEPQRITLMQSYVRDVFTTGIMSDWAMRTVEDNTKTLRDPNLV